MLGSLWPERSHRPCMAVDPGHGGQPFGRRRSTREASGVGALAPMRKAIARLASSSALNSRAFTIAAPPRRHDPACAALGLQPDGAEDPSCRRTGWRSLTPRPAWIRRAVPRTGSGQGTPRIAPRSSRRGRQPPTEGSEQSSRESTPCAAIRCRHPVGRRCAARPGRRRGTWCPMPWDRRGPAMSHPLAHRMGMHAGAIRAPHPG